MDNVYVLIAVAAVVAHCLGFALGRRLRGARIKELEAAIREAGERLDGAENTVEDAERRRRIAEAEAERQAKLAQDRFEMIDGVVQEKQIVWRMYRDSTRQAGVAQNWLLREYSAALQGLNAYRKKAGEREIQAPEQLRALLNEFGAMAAAVPDEPPGDTPASGAVAAKGA